MTGITLLDRQLADMVWIMCTALRAGYRVRFVKPIIWSIIALACLCLGGCNYSNPAFSQKSLTLPLELRIEERALQDKPQIIGESMSFVPVQGTQEEVLSKHQDERSKLFSDYPIPAEPTISLGGDQLTAATNETNGESVQISRNGTTIYTIQVDDSNTIPISPLRGFWANENHWILEVAHITRFSFFNWIDFNVWGEIIQDGNSLNKQSGYQEAFGFQLMKGKPFYFFKKHGQLGISYNGVEIPLGYTQVPHYGCCSASALNPRSAKNMAAFFAKRGKIWYYVEIGVFE